MSQIGAKDIERCMVVNTIVQRELCEDALVSSEARGASVARVG